MSAPANRARPPRAGQAMRAVFVDANPTLADLAARLHRPVDPGLTIHRQPDVDPVQLPEILGDAHIALIDHTALPVEIARRCENLRHVVFLGTGARSYMNPEQLAHAGIAVHTIKGYGDTAVAECAFALMWAAAKGLAGMDGAMRAGRWLRTDGVQLTGKTLGLIGFGSIAAELARLALGCGMTVLAWNRTPRSHPGVDFVGIDRLLDESHVVSLHLLLTDETAGYLSRERIAMMRPGAILINTARGALVDERALVDALGSGHLAHAGLDVFTTEPLPYPHVLTTLPNVTLSAHSAFRTPEASVNLIEAALAHCRRIAGSATQARIAFDGAGHNGCLPERAGAPPPLNCKHQENHLMARVREHMYRDKLVRITINQSGAEYLGIFEIEGEQKPPPAVATGPETHSEDAAFEAARRKAEEYIDSKG